MHIVADVSARVAVAGIAGASTAAMADCIVPVPDLPFTAVTTITLSAIALGVMVQARPDPWRPWAMGILVALVGGLGVVAGQSMENRLQRLEENGAQSSMVAIARVEEISMSNQEQARRNEAQIRDVLEELRQVRLLLAAR